MNPNKRVWIASILSSLFAVSYINFVIKPTSSFQRQQNSQASQLTKQNEQGGGHDTGHSEYQQLTGKEHVRTIIGEDIALDVLEEAPVVESVTLEKHRDRTTGTAIRISTGRPIFAVDGEGDAPWIFLAQSHDSATWKRIGVANGETETVTISARREAHVFDAVVSIATKGTKRRSRLISVGASWKRVDKVAGRYNVLESVVAVENGHQLRHVSHRESLGRVDNVPRGTQFATLSERYFCESIKPDKRYPARTRMLTTAAGIQELALSSDISVEPNQAVEEKISVYVGPRDFFRMRDAGFERAFKIGFLAQIGLVLLVGLKGIAGLTHNYGLAIIALSGAITLALSPLTLSGLRSMKRLQELQPKLEQLKKKHEKDSQKLNKEMMELFREHRVSPLGGCLPMLIQLPVFFALLSAVSHMIELRGANFLWIHDLSLPDRLTTLPFGLELNLLPILTAVAMYLQTKRSQQVMSSGTPNIMSGPMMSVMFGLMLYNVPSGLALYWLSNSLFSVALYKIGRI